MNFFHLVLFATIDVSLFQSSSQFAPVSIIASHLFCQILLEGPHWLCLHRRWNNPDPQPQEQITLSNSVFFSAYRRRNLPLFQERTDCCRHLPFLVNSPSQLLQFYIVQSMYVQFVSVMVILKNTFLEIEIIRSNFCLTCCFEVTIAQNSRVTTTKVLVACFKKNLHPPPPVVWVCSRRLVKHTLCTFLQISLCVLSSPLKGYLCATKHTLVHLEGGGGGGGRYISAAHLLRTLS